MTARLQTRVTLDRSTGADWQRWRVRPVADPWVGGHATWDQLSAIRAAKLSATLGRQSVGDARGSASSSARREPGFAVGDARVPARGERSTAAPDARPAVADTARPTAS